MCYYYNIRFKIYLFSKNLPDNTLPLSEVLSFLLSHTKNSNDLQRELPSIHIKGVYPIDFPKI